MWWVLAATRLLHNLCHFSAAFKDFTNVIIKTGNCALLGSSGIRRLGTLRTVYNSVHTWPGVWHGIDTNVAHYTIVPVCSGRCLLDSHEQWMSPRSWLSAGILSLHLQAGADSKLSPVSPLCINHKIFTVCDWYWIIIGNGSNVISSWDQGVLGLELLTINRQRLLLD